MQSYNNGDITNIPKVSGTYSIGENVTGMPFSGGCLAQVASDGYSVAITVWFGNTQYIKVGSGDVWDDWDIHAIATPPQVHNLPLLDGYSLGVDGAGYSKTQEGIVSVYFSVYGEFVASSSDIGGEAFAILPEGFRPTGKIPVPVVQQDIPGPDWVKVIVHPDGSMRYYGNGSTTAIYGSVSFVAS
ncbi:hypothetical protein [Pseudoflavonifractor phocaeensis]|uniref:hypothetical protein n=1 Tax=Pseudoflavonifractor phocaeensis TaxID=1870988 RepID=UPI00195ADB6B|nr:hypothetical protein [Pseudoflavonifractor phocaeensis]MBM6886821.1 hypothetical protein [Pseudoflavonifractor phocaeensis]